MAIEIPRSLVEFILLGPEDDRRQLQDSPILGDVWLEFAKDPGRRLELLITPYKAEAAVTVARTLAASLAKQPPGTAVDGRADIAYLQGIVAARLSFEEVLCYVIPMTSWWNDARISTAMKGYIDQPSLMERDIEATFDQARKWLQKKSDDAMQDLETRRRYAALTGLIIWANQQGGGGDPAVSSREQAVRILANVKAADVAHKLAAVFDVMKTVPAQSLVWTISINRHATPAIVRSVPAVKADAARTLFTVNCEEIVWAVIDSGIDGTHYAFREANGIASRVRRTFDFTRIRDIVTLDNLTEAGRGARVTTLLGARLKAKPDGESIAKDLAILAQGAEEGRPINWEIVERLVELDPSVPPPTHHGTHVAGILGSGRTGAIAAAEAAAKAAGGPVLDPSVWGDGMCPDISLYDFRVLAPSLRETEFAIIAALQYIRYINERNSYMTIHGANLSLSIPHDVRNFACGRTPICNECERLVNSGVVVVAAAGNRGYQNFETSEGRYESYAAFSVTDPGNADGVVTVGSTHRFWPHTYGVSFFSSRGPTGDGRMKPDLVAPGERVRAPVRGNAWGDLDGTSMAAPHVSGAAAMLMARYSELIGQPRRIKDLLCRTATDLGRERSFQGHGMLDVLRAFQGI